MKDKAEGKKVLYKNAVVGVFSLAVSVASEVSAIECTWNFNAAYESPASAGVWNDEANWTGGVPGSSDNAVFSHSRL